MVAGGIAAGGAAALTWLWARCATGVPNLDRWGIRGRVCIQAILTFGPRALGNVDLVRALMAICKNESPAGGPAPGSAIIGDQGASGGPSIGPMQVYRATARDLGLWDPPGVTIGSQQDRDLYAAQAADEATCIAWGVKVFQNKFHLASEDLPEAIRRYNGSGAKAEKYRDLAIAFINDRWGGLAA